MKTKLKLIVIGHLLAAICLSAFAQGTVFTYQGRVTDNGTNFTGSGQFKFALVTSTNTSSQATATAHLTSDGSGHYYVSSYTVTSGGSGYLAVPNVTVSGGGGSGATATAVISGGVVTQINPHSDGSAYLFAPTVTIDAPPANITYTTYWSNDGTSADGSEPSAAVNVTVNGGLFTVVLGGTNVANMTAIDASLFAQPGLQLQIWFNDGVNGFAALSPLQNLTPTPYAVNAVFANSASNLVNGLTIQQNVDDEPNVIAGAQNTVSDGAEGATIGGGYANIAGANGATLSGGSGNFSTGQNATVAGGNANTASGMNAAVGGGDNNGATDQNATVSGGEDNSAGSPFATVSGGKGNIASGFASFIGGGGDDGEGDVQGNMASGGASVIGGGIGNQAIGFFATVGGGYNNAANRDYSFAGGGYHNTASGYGAFVGGGGTDGLTFTGNRANGAASVIGGGLGNTASGNYATVPGGDYNTASGQYSFAAGKYANSINDGAFVWADSQGSFFSSTANNQFLIRAGGGVGIDTGTTIAGSLTINTNTYLDDHPIYLRGLSGVDTNHGLAYNGNTTINFGTGQYQVDGPALWGYNGGLLGTRNGGDHAAVQWNTTSVTVNGTFNNNSDRNAKQNFTAVTPSQVLDEVAQLPLSEWSYKVDAATRHIGPMAQDFYSAFNVGTDDKHIAPIDEGGVALAAIQGLNQKLQEESKVKDAEIQTLKQENTSLEKRLDNLQQTVKSFIEKN